MHELVEEKDVEQILKIILDSLSDKEFEWYLDGSANLRVQGVNTSINDLDITTNDEGIEIFRTALKKFIVKDFFSQKVKGPSLICKMSGFEVEINSFGERKKNMFEKTKKISWNNLQVSILPLEYAKVFYELINRKDKVELISKYLKN
jgi:hypothetical protein